MARNLVVYCPSSCHAEPPNLSGGRHGTADYWPSAMLDTREHLKALLLWMKALPLQRGLTQHSCWTCLWRGEHQVRLSPKSVSRHLNSGGQHNLHALCSATMSGWHWLAALLQPLSIRQLADRLQAALLGPLSMDPDAQGVLHQLHTPHATQLWQLHCQPSTACSCLHPPASTTTQIGWLTMSSSLRR